MVHRKILAISEVACEVEAAQIGKVVEAEVVHLSSMTVTCSAVGVGLGNHGVVVIE
jgi:hypothetical protein